MGDEASRAEAGRPGQPGPTRDCACLAPLGWPMGRQAIIRGKNAHLRTLGITTADPPNSLRPDTG
jgi:hypothetical protein